MEPNHAVMQTVVRRYLLVYGVDLALTAIMLGMALMNLPLRVGIVVVLTIAVVRGALMTGVLMRVGEHPIVYTTLLLTIVLVVGLLVWPAVGHLDRVRF